MFLPSQLLPHINIVNQDRGAIGASIANYALHRRGLSMSITFRLSSLKGENRARLFLQLHSWQMKAGKRVQKSVKVGLWISTCPM